MDIFLEPREGAEEEPGKPGKTSVRAPRSCQSYQEPRGDPAIRESCDSHSPVGGRGSAGVWGRRTAKWPLCLEPSVRADGRKDREEGAVLGGGHQEGFGSSSGCSGQPERGPNRGSDMI